MTMGLAVELGLTLSELTKLVDEHGEEVLKILNDGLASGLSPTFLLEALNLGGKVLVEILVDVGVVRAKAIAKLLTASPLEEGKQVEVAGSDAVLGTILQQLLQNLFTPANIQALITWLLGVINTQPTPAPTPVITPK
jgi:hypothetical protein